MSRGIWITYALLFLVPHLCSAEESTTLTIINKCNDIIWPALLSTAGAPPWRPATGFLQVLPGESKTLALPPNWTGRLWGQTLCNRVSGGSTTAGKLSCGTGDCSAAECLLGGTTATLAEFTLNGGAGAGGHLDAYLVSLVHGFNLPMAVVPRGGNTGNCTESGCFIDLNENCPRELRVVVGKRTVGCRSACEAFGEPYYCCTAWKYGDGPASGECKAKSYSKFFGGSCPLGSVTFTCDSKDYVVTFCPSKPNSSSTMSSNEFKSADGTEIYDDFDKKNSNTALKGFGIFVGVLTVLAVVFFMGRLLFGRSNPEQGNVEINVITCVKVG